MTYFDAIYPEFDIFWGMAVPGHGGGEELTGYVWWPARDNWFRHDPDGRYIYIGHNLQGNDIASIEQALGQLYPIGINTYSLIAITRFFMADPGTLGIPEEWTAPANHRHNWKNQLAFYDELLTQIDAYVASGQVEYLSLTEVKELFIHNEDALDFDFDLEDIPRSSKPLAF